MGPPPPQPQGFCAPWPWGIGERKQRSSPDTWWIDRMEGGLGGGEGGGAGLRFSLQFDPGKPSGLDRALLGVSLPELFSRLLGWSRNGQGRGSTAIAEEGGDSGAAAVSAAVLATAVSVCLAATYASDQRRRGALRRRRRLSASALSGPNPVARPRALPAPDDGLRILSTKDESLENVIHGTAVGAGEEEPVIVARVATAQTDVAGGNANGETEDGRLEEERRQELERLRELWQSLLEREQRLELRLQELEGLREQEAATRELENRVAASAMEARMLELKVSSLQEENGRLRAQVAELDTARAELGRAREKLRAIKARVQGEQEEAAALRARVEELERGGEERASALPEEVAALRRANAALEEENTELALRLQDAEQAASSVNLVLEEDMVGEVKYLRETNERLTRQIEQLHSDHCAHVEEHVYLKWVNACLRHELGDHGLHPPSSAQQDQEADGSAGAADLSAMELSKSMSFRSSEMAKQIMLRYGHPGLFSALHESIDGDGEERARARRYDEPAERSPGAPVTAATMAAPAAAAPGKKAGPRKLKFLGSIRKLLPGGGGKKTRGGHGAGRESAARAPVPRDEYLEKAMQWLSAHDVLDVDHSYESTPLSSCERTPLSSVTTATTRGGGEAQADAGPETLERSRSDAGASYGQEASRYHALRPDHPAEVAVEPDALGAPEKQLRRRSEELIRSPGAGGART